MSVESLIGKYRNIFSYFERKKRFNVIIISFDAEWQEFGGKNRVISYQIASLVRHDAKNVIEYMQNDQRLSLEEVVEIGIRSVHDGQLPDLLRNEPTFVLLIAHHVTAEWSVLRDRRSPHILSNLTVIRKSPVCGRSAIPIELSNGAVAFVAFSDSRLLAPAGFQSLKKLSSLLGSDDDLKIDIPHFFKKRMGLFRKLHPRRYEEYSLQDSAVTLKVYLLLLDSIIKLSGKGEKKGRTKFYRTLASGAVIGYLVNYPGFVPYRKKLKSSEYTEAMRLFRRGYHGGRNEGFLLGRTDRQAELKNRLWCDVDFCGAYPTTMALCPAIANGVNPLADQYLIVPPATPTGRPRKLLLTQGPYQPVRYLPLTYRLDDRSDEAILKEGVTPANYRRVKIILDELAEIAEKLPINSGSPIDEKERVKVEADLFRRRSIKQREFDAELVRIRAGVAVGSDDNDIEELKQKRGKKTNREQARRLRELATVVDNSLVDEWYARWKKGKGSPEIERHLIAGVARVRFCFPDDTQYPNLPISHEKYGLVFPLVGECVVPCIDILTAMDAGARIEALCSVEFPVQYDEETGEVRRTFFKHIKKLVEQRAKFKGQSKNEDLSPSVRQKAVVFEQLAKEYNNSFYGKTSQSIRSRRSYGLRTGEMQSLGPSRITEPCTAALTTGLARAALGALLHAVQRYNKDKPSDRQILVASVTTDGALLGLPRPEGDFRTADCYEWGKGKGLELKKKYTNVATILELCKCEGLITEMMNSLALRQMRTSRKELTGDDTFLEVKNLADHATFVKTRGQLGWIDYQSTRRSFYKSGRAFTISAKFGLKPPLSEIVAAGVSPDNLSDSKLMRLEQRYARLYEGPTTDRNTVEGEWVLQQLDRMRDENRQATSIFEYSFYTLTGFNEIIKAEDDDKDLIQKVRDRKFNGDYDWKRRLKLGADDCVSPFSDPYLNITEMLAHRGQMEEERRWNRNALPEKVLHRVQLRGRGASMRGGEEAAVVRTFLRLMESRYLPGVKLGRRIHQRLNSVWTEQGFSMRRMLPKGKPRKGNIDDAGKTPRVKMEWTQDDVKYARRSNDKDFKLNCIIPSLPLLKLVAALATEFKVDPERVKGLIFSDLGEEVITPQLAMLVARAVLHGPGRRLEPFRSLYLAGSLPTKAGLVQAFYPYLTESMVEECARASFQAGEGASWDRPRVTVLFRRLGLSAAEAEACARVVVLPGRAKDKVPANPARKRCLDCFVHALHQRDIVPQSIRVAEIIDTLQPFGLRRHQYYALKQSKFLPRCLSDTPGNRRQINRMARLLRLDPAPIMESLLDR